MAYVAMAYTVMAYVAMACVVMAYIAMACVVMACIVMAYIVMAYIVVMAYIGVLPTAEHTTQCRGQHTSSETAMPFEEGTAMALARNQATAASLNHRSSSFLSAVAVARREVPHVLQHACGYGGARACVRVRVRLCEHRCTDTRVHGRRRVDEQACGCTDA